jgi:hypothetical protein
MTAPRRTNVYTIHAGASMVTRQANEAAARAYAEDAIRSHPMRAICGLSRWRLGSVLPGGGSNTVDIWAPR